MYFSRVTGIGGFCTSCLWSTRVLVAFFRLAFFFLFSFNKSLRSSCTALMASRSFTLAVFVSSRRFLASLLSKTVHQSPELGVSLPLDTWGSSIWRIFCDGYLVRHYNWTIQEIYGPANNKTLDFPILEKINPLLSEWPISGMGSTSNYHSILPY